FLAAIVDSSNDAIISKTPEGLILTWNRAAERIFGYTAKEVIGKPVLRLFPPERIHEEAMLMQRVLRGEPIRNMETQRLRKDGQLIDLSISVS
ncbi:PAS domain S-box protein, partial [Acinetobacter baumannii]